MWNWREVGRSGEWHHAHYSNAFLTQLSSTGRKEWLLPCLIAVNVRTAEPITKATPGTETIPDRSATEAVATDLCRGEWRYPENCTGRECTYVAEWAFDDVTDDITFNIQTDILRDKHWTGIGFSQDQFMENSDVILAVILTDGSGSAQDGWASGYDMPRPDLQTDLKRVNFTHNDGISYIQFARARDTGDELDYTFTDDKCGYFLFPYSGGDVDIGTGVVGKHFATPVVVPVCISACTETEPSTVAVLPDVTTSHAEPSSEPTKEPTTESVSTPEPTPEPVPEPRSTVEPEPGSEPSSEPEATVAEPVTTTESAEPASVTTTETTSTAEPTAFVINTTVSTPEPETSSTAEPVLRSRPTPEPEPRSTPEPSGTTELKRASTTAPLGSPEPKPVTSAEPSATPEPIPVTREEPSATPEPKPVTSAEPSATPEPKPVTSAEPSATPEPKPVTTAEPSATPEPKPLTTAEPSATPEPKPATTAEPSVTAEPKPDTTAEPSGTLKPIRSTTAKVTRTNETPQVITVAASSVEPQPSTTEPSKETQQTTSKEFIIISFTARPPSTTTDGPDVITKLRDTSSTARPTETTTAKTLEPLRVTPETTTATHYTTPSRQLLQLQAAYDISFKVTNESASTDLTEERKAELWRDVELELNRTLTPVDGYQWVRVVNITRPDSSKDELEVTAEVMMASSAETENAVEEERAKVQDWEEELTTVMKKETEDNHLGRMTVNRASVEVRREQAAVRLTTTVEPPSKQTETLMAGLSMDEKKVIGISVAVVAVVILIVIFVLCGMVRRRRRSGSAHILKMSNAANVDSKPPSNHHVIDMYGIDNQGYRNDNNAPANGSVYADSSATHTPRSDAPTVLVSAPSPSPEPPIVKEEEEDRKSTSSSGRGSSPDEGQSPPKSSQQSSGFVTTISVDPSAATE